MKDKRILFFAPNFFGYDLEIKKSLEKMGAVVDFYDDRPANSVFYKVLIRLSPRMASRKIHRYFNNIIEQNKNTKYDYIFFIKCESALEKDLFNLHEKFGEAKFILYLYDSIKNIRYFDMKKKYFDEIYSFDLGDVKKTKDMKFLPLFYLDCYKKDETEEYKYDLSFIGTAHSDRPKIINCLRKQLVRDERTYFFQLYVPSKVIFYIKKFIYKDFRELYECGHITLEKIPTKVVIDIIKVSNVILDVQHPRQTGLTIRTIELLGMNKKIATTNENIKEYDFYDNQNIMIIDRNLPSIDDVLFMKKFKTIPNEIYESYSIHTWIERIFSFINKGENDG